MVLFLSVIVINGMGDNVRFKEWGNWIKMSNKFLMSWD